MAQELLNIKPEAVSIIDRYYMVNYSLLDVNLERVV